MKSLEALAEARSEILKTEVAALLHNLGKLSREFLANQRDEKQYKSYEYRAITGLITNLCTERHKQVSDKKCPDFIKALADKQLDSPLKQAEKDWLRDTMIRLPHPFDDRNYSLADFIELQQHKWYEPRKQSARQIDILFPNGSKATELLEVAHHQGSGSEKDRARVHELKKQTRDITFLATVFGYETPMDIIGMEEGRSALLSKMKEIVGMYAHPPADTILSAARTDALASAREILTRGLGDTQRPINDVTLWDLSYSVASLHKASIAQCILSGWPAVEDPEANRALHDKVKWRLLSVSFDGPRFWGRSQHATDLLGRRRVLGEGLDAVRNLLEFDYPLGNEIYRDEYGSVFAVPDIEMLLSLKGKNDRELQALLRENFERGGVRGEIETELRLWEPMNSARVDLARVLTERSRSLRPNASVVSASWGQGRPVNSEVCTVCGLRPVGYPDGETEGEELRRWAKSSKAIDRNVCRFCLERRGRRAYDWARNNKDAEIRCGPFESTIWTEEVADGNGRAALVVGRFILDDWINGKLVSIIGKPASYARIRRCWETTRRFWLDVVNEIIPKGLEGTKRLRLGLKPQNVQEINSDRKDAGLGRWHTYEADIGGVRLGLCWDPVEKDGPTDRNVFWTIANLNYFAKRLGISEWKNNENLPEALKRHLETIRVLYEPGGYQKEPREVGVKAGSLEIVHRRFFLPFVPLVVEPSIFLALVPADKAMELTTAIKNKFDVEMGQVCDRLPLHLGLVFFPRRTPLPAVIETGRRMLGMNSEWEEWQVVVAPRRKATFTRGDSNFEHEYYEKVNRDPAEETVDIWHPRLNSEHPSVKRQDGSEQELGSQLVDGMNGPVFVSPGRFDFEFLDTAARRFEITYGENGRRRKRRTRPFLLDDLTRLDEIWKQMCDLKVSQRHQIIQTIEATREAWFGADSGDESWSDPVFKQFVQDTLACAAWRAHPWKGLGTGERERLARAGVTGELADLAEIYMEIVKEDAEPQEGTKDGDI